MLVNLNLIVDNLLEFLYSKFDFFMKQTPKILRLMRFSISVLVEINYGLLFLFDSLFSFKLLISVNCILISISFPEANTEILKICEVLDLWIG